MNILKFVKNSFINVGNGYLRSFHPITDMKLSNKEAFRITLLRCIFIFSLAGIGIVGMICLLVQHWLFS